MFQVISLATNEPILNPETQEPLTFPDGKSAQLVANEKYAETGIKHIPKPILSHDWRKRNEERLASKEWKIAPWNDPDGEYPFNAYAHHFGEKLKIPDHFAHIAEGKDGQIAYTETIAKGISDVTTRMKPGRYLSRFFKEVLTAGQIETLALSFAAKYEELVLQFARTPEEIEWVYTNGPHSCMAGKTFSSFCHPVRAYSGPDLAVAYVKLSESERASGRCLVWPDKKIHSRIYGDVTRMNTLLKKDGYKEGRLTGARISRIPDKRHKGSFVIPFIDNVSGAKDDGTYLVLGTGYLPTDHTNGLSSS